MAGFSLCDKRDFLAGKAVIGPRNVQVSAFILLRLLLDLHRHLFLTAFRLRDNFLVKFAKVHSYWLLFGHNFPKDYLLFLLLWI